jgi:hypothetical protein
MPLACLRGAVLATMLTTLLVATACSEKSATPAGPETAAKPAEPAAATESSILPDEGVSEASTEQTGDLHLPVHLQRRTGDLDEMLRARNIRALVLLNPITSSTMRAIPAASPTRLWKNSSGS